MRRRSSAAIVALLAVGCSSLPKETTPDIHAGDAALKSQTAAPPAFVTITAESLKPDESEPPLKWELVAAGSLSHEGEDPYHTWASPQWVMRLPGEFTEVPAAIRDELNRQGCRIPQWIPGTVPHNLLWGEFDRRGQRDLAVLCVREKSATAYIFWAGEVARREVLPFGGPGSTLSIGTAEDIEAHAAADARVDADMPQVVDHDAIEVGCCECCGSYYYRHLGRWFQAAGPD
jgi:hypothetical protein